MENHQLTVVLKIDVKKYISDPEGASTIVFDNKDAHQVVVAAWLKDTPEGQAMVALGKEYQGYRSEIYGMQIWSEDDMREKKKSPTFSKARAQVCMDHIRRIRQDVWGELAQKTEGGCQSIYEWIMDQPD